MHARNRHGWIAALVSGRPGLGHIYAGQARRGLILFAAAGIVGYLNSFLLARGLSRPAFIADFTIWQLVLIAIAYDAWYVARRAPRPYVLQKYNRWYVYVSFVLLGSLLSSLPRPVKVAGVQQPSTPVGLLPGEWFYLDTRASTRRALHDGETILYAVPGDSSAKVGRVVRLSRDTVTLSGDGRIAESQVLGSVRNVLYSYDPASDVPYPVVSAARWWRLGALPR